MSTNAQEISKSRLIDWLESNGWMVAEINGRLWELVEIVDSKNRAYIEVTAHKDGSTAHFVIS